MQIDERLQSDFEIQIQIQNILGYSEFSDKFTPFFDVVENNTNTSILVSLLVVAVGLGMFAMVFFYERFKYKKAKFSQETTAFDNQNYE